MSTVHPRIVSVGTANPPRYYKQADLPDLFMIKDKRLRSLFTSGHIDGRHLYLPDPDAHGIPTESQGQLLHKHLRGSMEIGPQAIRQALEHAELHVTDVDYLVVTTTTGFLAPGLSAHLMNEMGFRSNCGRADVVGMGCNAGLNGLNPATHWAMANPGKNALLVCIEVCSAAYVFDNTIETGIVNSLFGDGAAAAVIRAEPADAGKLAPVVLDFESHVILPALQAMRFDWDDSAGKFSFFLARDIPYVIGEHAETPVDRLLSRHQIKRRHIAHWLVHSGGKKVIDALKYNLGLTTWDVRHTVSVLHDFGNLSSASFLFSYQRLLNEARIRRGDYGVMITMGPGTTIETALLHW